MDQNEFSESAWRSGPRAASQFLSWIVRGRWSLIPAYLRVRRSGEFDRTEYLSAYPDVAQARLDPLMHYVEHGRREGREPSVVQGPASEAPNAPRSSEEPLLPSAPAVEDDNEERDDSVDWSTHLGEPVDVFWERVLAEQRPDVRGTFSPAEATFLFGRVAESGASTAVELIERPNVSTLILLRGLETAARANGAGGPFRIESFLESESPPIADPAAPHEPPPHSFGRHVRVRRAGVLDLKQELEVGEVGFLYLDSFGPHPKGTLALLAALPVLAPRAIVVLRVDRPSGGTMPRDKPVLRAFLYELDVERRRLRGDESIGSFSVPENKADFRKQLTAMLFALPWEETPPESWLAAAIGPAEPLEDRRSGLGIAADGAGHVQPPDRAELAPPDKLE
jgi:hypothetical protein